MAIKRMEIIKGDLALYALEHDFFGYGTIVVRHASGKYRAIVEGEVYYLTLKDLAKQFDELDDYDRRDIIEAYAKDILLQDKDLQLNVG